MEADRLDRWRWPAVVLLVGILLVSSLTEAPAHLPFSLCVFRNVTGLPCPGCGMTRGFVAMGHGHLADAWRYNRLSPGVYAFAWLALLYMLLAPSYRALWRWRLSNRVRGPLYAVLLILILASWISFLMKGMNT